MRKTISLLLCVLMTLALFCVGISAAGGTLTVEYQIGTINAADGLENTANKTRLHSPDYIPLADAEGVTVKDGYQLAWLAYGKDKNYLGNGNNYKGLWQPNGGPIRCADILALYPDAVYFRFGIRNVAGTNVTLSDVEASGVTVVAAGGSLTGDAPAITEDVLGTTFLPAEYQIGTINAADGLENTANKSRLFNPAYVPLADAVGVQVKSGYQLTWLAYGKDQTYLGNGNNNKGLWQPDGASFKSSDILAIYPDAVYFRYALRNLAGTNLDLTDVEKSGVTLVAAEAPAVITPADPATEPAVTDTPAAPVTEPVAPVAPVQTADTAVYFIAAAVIAVLGCAFIFRKSTVK